AAMGLQFTIARAVAEGVVKEHLPFIRTDKGGVGARTRFPAMLELVIGALLVAGAVLLLATNKNEVREIYILAAVLVVQSLPFLSAAAIAALERSMWNDFATWRKLAVVRAPVTTPLPPANPPAIAD